MNDTITIKRENLENLLVDTTFLLQVNYSFLKVKNLSIPTIIWLCFMISRQEYFRKRGEMDEDGYFYYTQKFVNDHLASISPKMQTAIIKFLRGEYIETIKDDKGNVMYDEEGKPLKETKKGIGVLLVKENIGLPARNYYKIDYEALFEYVEKETQRQLIESNRATFQN